MATYDPRKETMLLLVHIREALSEALLPYIAKKNRASAKDIILNKLTDYQILEMVINGRMVSKKHDIAREVILHEVFSFKVASMLRSISKKSNLLKELSETFAYSVPLSIFKTSSRLTEAKKFVSGKKSFPSLSLNEMKKIRKNLKPVLVASFLEESESTFDNLKRMEFLSKARLLAEQGGGSTGLEAAKDFFLRTPYEYWKKVIGQSSSPADVARIAQQDVRHAARDWADPKNALPAGTITPEAIGEFGKSGETIALNPSYIGGPTGPNPITHPLYSSLEPEVSVPGPGDEYSLKPEFSGEVTSRYYPEPAYGTEQAEVPQLGGEFGATTPSTPSLVDKASEKISDFYTNLKQMIDKHEGSFQQVKQWVDSNPTLAHVIGGVALAGLLAYAGRKIYRRHISAYGRACSHLKGAAFDECVQKAKSEALKKEISQVQTSMSLCRKTSNPSKCQAFLRKRLMKLIQKRQKLSKA